MEQKKSEQATSEKALTPKALIIGIICVIFISWFSSQWEIITAEPNFEYPGLLTQADYVWGQGAANVWWIGLGFSTTILAILAIVNQIKPIFSKQEILVIAVMSMIPAVQNGLGAGPHPFKMMLYSGPTSFNRYFYPVEDIPNMLNALPSILKFGNDPEFWYQASIHGSYPINWSYSFVPLVFWTIFILSIALTLFFATLLCRRLFIDVENLNFPIASLQTEMVNSTQRDNSKVGFFKNKYLLLGFCIIFFWMLILTYRTFGTYFGLYPHSLNNVFKWGTIGEGNPLAAECIVAWPAIELNGFFDTPFIVLSLDISPWFIGWCALLSMDTIVGFLVGWIAIWVIAPAVLVGSGLWPIAPAGSVSYSMEQRIDFDATSIGKWTTSLGAGVTVNARALFIGLLAGLLLYSIWRNRDTMIPILKGLVKEPAPEVDPDKPMAYRKIWISMIISGFVAVICTAVMEANILMFIIGFALMIFMALANTRMIAESGGLWGGSWWLEYYARCWPFMLMAPILYGLFPQSLSADPITGFRTPANTMTVFLGIALAYSLFLTMCSTSITTLESIKMGSMTKTSLKSTLKAVIIALVLAIIILAFFNHYWTYAGNATYIMTPLANDQLVKVASGTELNMFKAQWETLQMLPAQTIAMVIIGLALAFIIPALRTQWTWLRLGVGGLAFGVNSGGYMFGPMIIALIIKFVTLRIGGSKAWNEKVAPLMVGMALAGVVGYFLFVSLVGGQLVEYNLGVGLYSWLVNPGWWNLFKP